MTNLKFILIFFLLTTVGFAQNIDEHKWKNRVVLVFADEQHQDLLNDQFSILNKDQQQLTDRKLVIYTCNTEKCTLYKGDGSKILVPLKRKVQGFEFRLIGLDGGVKKRSRKVVSREDLFALIDGMPMRRQELKTKQIKND